MFGRRTFGRSAFENGCINTTQKSNGYKDRLDEKHGVEVKLLESARLDVDGMKQMLKLPSSPYG